MITIDKILDEMMKLDFSSREMLLEILYRRNIEEKRKEITHNARNAKKEFSKRKLKPISAEAVIARLNTL